MSDKPVFIHKNPFGRIETVDGNHALEIEQVPGHNPVTNKPYRQHNVVLLNGNPNDVELVGAYNTKEEAELAYDKAAEQVTLEDALVVLDERSLKLYHLHFSEPLVNNWNLPQHYTGCTNNLDRRLKEHVRGSDVPFVRESVRRGHTFEVAWTKVGGYAEERQIKAWNNGRRICPICNGGVK